jgi:hypothetical protein
MSLEILAAETPAALANSPAVIDLVGVAMGYPFTTELECLQAPSGQAKIHRNYSKKRRGE